jgi:hypothetical protein
MAADKEMARRLDRSYGDGPNDPIEVDDERPHQWPRPPPPGNQLPLSPSPPSKRVTAIKRRIIKKQSSLDSGDDEVSLYKDILESLNDTSHPRHLANIGMSRDSVELDEDEALKVVGCPLPRQLELLHAPADC